MNGRPEVSLKAPGLVAAAAMVRSDVRGLYVGRRNWTLAQGSPSVRRRPLSYRYLVMMQRMTKQPVGGRAQQARLFVPRDAQVKAADDEVKFITSRLCCCCCCCSISGNNLNACFNHCSQRESRRRRRPTVCRL
jgi:hypothetical protein